MAFKFNPFTDKLDIVDTGSSSSGVTQLTGDDSVAVLPSAGNINVFGTNGIQTSGSGSTLTITDKLVSIGTAQTIGAVTSTIVSIPLTSSQTVMVQCIISAYESTTPAAFGGQVLGTVFRAGAAAAAVIPTPDVFSSESAALSNANINISASGNNAIVTVTGQAGLTVNWRAAAFYITQPA